MGHIHAVTDTDAYFEIDAITRKIQAKSGKTALIQGDHNSERFTFKLPRMIDSHDMALCNRVQVHYINTDATTKEQSKGIYEVDDMEVNAEDEASVVLTWLISCNATKYTGILSFLIKFKCVDEFGKVDYVWNTSVFSGIAVSNGIDNGEAVVEAYADILEQWREELKGGVAGGSGGSSARVANVELLAANWVGDTSPYSQIVTIDGITEFSQVDLTPSVEQLAIFYDKDLALVAENENGVVTVYAIGDKPSNDYTMQVTIKEVSV